MKLKPLKHEFLAATEVLAVSQTAAVATAPAPGRGEVALMRKMKDAERQLSVEAVGTCHTYV